ncbi:MAG: hypothetical protein R6U38_12345 [Desulfatiglandaceae bacterium]
MQQIWIIGAGRFGHLAFERLSKTFRDKQFVLVDPDRENLSQCHGEHLSKEQTDGVAFLSRRLDHGHGPEPAWIIPALPVHLAAEWLLHHLGPDRLQRVDLPSALDPLIPHPIRGQSGDIYVTHATFRCPDDCAEPKDICTVTGKKRKQNMFEVLGEIDLKPFQSLVIRSHQLGPGIGGYRPSRLYSLRQEMEQSPGPFLVSTACRCHGVITGLKWV